MRRGPLRFILTPAFVAATVLELSPDILHSEPFPAGVTVETLNLTPETLHVFSGAPVRLNLVVTAPAGAKLNLRADLLQTASGGLAASVQRDLPTADALEFGPRDNGRQLVEFTLPAAPVVPRSARFLLRFRAQGEGETDWRAAGAVTLFVHPDERAEWKKRLADGLQSRGWRLAVFGANPALRQFLRDRGVGFEDAGAEKPRDLDPKRLYIGEPPASADAASPMLSATSAGKLILLSPAPADGLPPGVYSSRNAAGGLVIRVTLPLLDRLADDPSRQRLLAEILRQALEPPAPASPPNPDPDSSP